MYKSAKRCRQHTEDGGLERHEGTVYGYEIQLPFPEEIGLPQIALQPIPCLQPRPEHCFVEEA